MSKSDPESAIFMARRPTAPPHPCPPHPSPPALPAAPAPLFTSRPPPTPPLPRAGGHRGRGPPQDQEGVLPARRDRQEPLRGVRPVHHPAVVRQVRGGEGRGERGQQGVHALRGARGGLHGACPGGLEKRPGPPPCALHRCGIVGWFVQLVSRGCVCLGVVREGGWLPAPPSRPSPRNQRGSASAAPFLPPPQAGKLHPGDLKAALTKALNAILQARPGSGRSPPPEFSRRRRRRRRFRVVLGPDGSGRRRPTAAGPRPFQHGPERQGAPEEGQGGSGGGKSWTGGWGGRPPAVAARVACVIRGRSRRLTPSARVVFL